MDNKKIKDLIKDYQRYAPQNGLDLNPDGVIVENLLKKILENEEKYGKRYCPCRLVSGNPREDDKKICPCAFLEAEIKRQGHCHCNLFIKARGQEVLNERK